MFLLGVYFVKFTLDKMTNCKKQLHMKLKYYVLAALLSSVWVNAQVNVDLKHTIEQVLLEPLTGNVLVEDKENISAIDAENHKVVWSIAKKDYSSTTTLQSIDKINSKLSANDFIGAFSKNEELSLIPNSPFALVNLENNDLIINAATGKVVFNSADAGYRILETYYMLAENALLVLGVKGDQIEFVNFDLSTKNIKWSNPLGTVDSLGKTLGGLFKVKRVAEDKIVSVGSTIMVTVKGVLYNIDKNTGNVNWNTSYSITNFFINQSKDKVVVITDESSLFSSKYALNVLNLSNGDKLWKDNITTKNISYLEDHQDKILVAHTTGFNFFSYKDGKKVWKKDAKGKNIKRVIPVEQDYLYIADNEMNLVNSNGENKWKKFVEIADDEKDEVYYLDKVGSDRVFYLTDTYGNMVDYVSGKKIWKKNVKFDKKRPLVYSVTGDKFLVYNNKRIYTFDANSTDDPKPKGKVEVNNDKTIKSIEAFDWGVCLVGENDVIGLDYEGNQLYHNTYKEPGEGQRRLLKSAGIVGGALLQTGQGANAAMANATVTMTYRDANGQLKSETGSLLTEAAQNRANRNADAFGGAADALDKNLTAKVKNRFNAMKQNDEYAFVANRGEKGPELVKVRKKDGQEVVKIELDGNKPLYEIDPVTENLYYASGTTLKIYTK